MHRCAFSLIGNQWLLTSPAIQMIYLHPVWMKPTEWMHHRTWAMQHNVDCVMRNNLRNIWNEYLINVSCDFNSSISMSSIAWQFDFFLINTHIIISLNLHRQPQKSDTFKATFALWTCLINSTRLTLIRTFRKLREKNPAFKLLVKCNLKFHQNAIQRHFSWLSWVETRNATGVILSLFKVNLN